MKKIIVHSFFGLLSSFGLFSCLTKPDFPFTPSIGFLDITKKSILDANNNVIEDSIKIWIKFKDGNGDIGLNTGDTTGNFSFKKPDGSPNPFYFNYYCTLFRRNKFTGQYERFPLPKDPTTNIETNINGRVPYLLEGTLSGPIEGQLLYNIGGLDPGIFNTKDSIRFEVFIYDRALNQSNTITTKSVLINP